MHCAKVIVGLSATFPLCVVAMGGSTLLVRRRAGLFLDWFPRVSFNGRFIWRVGFREVSQRTPGSGVHPSFPLARA